MAGRICAQNAREHRSHFDPTVRMWVFEEHIDPPCPEEVSRLLLRTPAEERAAPAFQQRLFHMLHLDGAPAELASRVARSLDRDFLHPADPSLDGEALAGRWKKWWHEHHQALLSAAVKRPLSEAIRRTGENAKYLSGIHLGPNLHPTADLREAVEGATLLVFVTPHQFVRGVCEELKRAGAVAEGARAVSLVKGMEVTEHAPYFEMISRRIHLALGVDCSVLMGANLALEIGKEGFSEATLGYRDARSAEAFRRLFHRPYFNVTAVEDVEGVELCGTLKNIVALGAGFVDGLGLGTNTKAAVLRIGLSEMRGLARRLFPEVKDETFFQSAGVGDLIATCYGGRNRKCAEEFAAAGGEASWEDIELRLLKGQKLQGVLTSHEVQSVLRANHLEAQFPLLTTINRIVSKEIHPSELTKYLC